MTAEIVIANGNGVALAADSAVTVGNQKIYNSAIKVFSLSKVHPVGIMIFGNASLLSVPWEVIIKSYRSELKKKSFKRVDGYAKHFLKYISISKQFHNKAAQDQWVRGNANGYFTLIREELFEKIHPLVEQHGEISKTESEKLLDETINEHYNSIKGMGLAEGIDTKFEVAIRKKYCPLFKKVREHIFEEIKPKKSSISKLYDIATWLHTRKIFSEDTSGIVIAGYGQDDIYPTILTYTIEGIIDGRLKYKKEKEKCFTIESGDDCIIIPFAQEEMVSTFMNGISPELADLVPNYIKQLFSRIPELAKGKDFKKAIADPDEFKKIFDKISINIVDTFFDKFKNQIQKKQIQPIMSMVRVLPKDELASMAETLVNITAFKRRVSNSLETVGGPIDVAVISMGDGLVWVKRKQYFPKELNSHFFDNYLKEVRND